MASNYNNMLEPIWWHVDTTNVAAGQNEGISHSRLAVTSQFYPEGTHELTIPKRNNSATFQIASDCAKTRVAPTSKTFTLSLATEYYKRP